jgi:hypothetical protein
MPNNSINYAYKHRHVFRDAINGVWGEPVGGSFIKDTIIQKEYIYLPNPLWKQENCSWVAFVYDTGTKEILQACKIKVEQK